MTADSPTHIENTRPSYSLQNFTILCAGATLFFALLSLIIGNHLSTLHADRLAVIKEIATSETSSIDEMKTDIETATGELQTLQQALSAEKAAAEKLRQKLSATEKELEKAKVDLASANKSISDLKTMPVAKPEPTIKTKPSRGPALEPPASGPPTSEKELVPVLPDAQTPPLSIPSLPATQAPQAPSPDMQPSTMPTGGKKTNSDVSNPSTVKPPSSENAPPIAEETIAASAQPAPATSKDTE